MKSFRLVILSVVVVLVACAGVPGGPTVQVLPPQGKPFEQFQSEQAYCEQYAGSQVSGEASKANNMGLLEGVGGTALGAGLGAALGGGRGAAIGAAGGALGGTAVGASTSSSSQGGIQQQYNNYYTQCMVSKGNVVQQPRPRPAPTVIYQQAPPPTVIYQQAPPVYVQQPPVYVQPGYPY